MLYIKSQPENCDNKKEPKLFSTGYGSSDHLILCPIKITYDLEYYNSIT